MSILIGGEADGRWGRSRNGGWGWGEGNAFQINFNATNDN